MTAVVVPGQRDAVRTHDAAARVPTTRLVAVEVRKMFDTRSGFWLMATVGVVAVLATVGVVAFAPEEALTYGLFATAFGFPMTVLLPVVALLSVTGEWSQRSGLTTFALVPHRGRVLAAKAVASVGVGVVSIPLAFAVGAVGNLVGTAVAGTDPVWDVTFLDASYIVLGNVLGLLVGFMLGVLVRSSAGAVVAYLAYAFVLPTVFGVLAQFQEWFRDVQPWVDLGNAQAPLFDGGPTGEQWAHLAVTSGLWLVLPLAVGLALVSRAEVK